MNENKDVVATDIIKPPEQDSGSSVIKVKKSKSCNKKQPDIMISILTRYMKKQNLLLLKKIADYKNVDVEELKMDFLKPNYFTPRIE